MMTKIRNLVNTDNPLVLGLAGGLLCVIIIPPLFYFHKDALCRLPEQTERAYFATAFAATVPGLLADCSSNKNIITSAWMYYKRFSARKGVSAMAGLNNDISRAVRTLPLKQACGSAERSNRKRSG